MVKKFFTTFLIITIIASSFVFGALFYLSQEPWVDFSVLENYDHNKPSILLDDEGIEWGRFSIDKRELIKFKHIPKNIINAFISAEDHNFFQHSGLSFKGIVRSIFVNILSRKKLQGASTITQQLVRLLFFESTKSFKRKIKEQLLSIIVELQFTKEQILETYLNNIYLGCGIYGIEAASQRFWGKHAWEVTNDEAAILASIVKSPNKLCPLNNPDQTLIRRNYVLNSMYKLGFINLEEYKKCFENPIRVIKEDKDEIAPHLKEEIRIFLEETLGKQQLYTGGLKIYTTLNLRTQKIAQKVFNENLEKLKKTLTPDLDGALISIDGKTGAIKALIGGYNYEKSQFNRALKAKRQMGSIFKPIIYATAIASGKSFADIEIDEPITLNINGQEWSPQNFYESFEGPMTLAKALSISNNIIPIKLLLNLGASSVIKMAQKCGIKENMNPYPSLALGCVDVTLDQTAAMINVFTQNGNYVEPYFIYYIKDEWGTKIYKNKEIKKYVLSSKITSQVAKILSIVVDRHKKRDPGSWFTFDALGKTGTTNDCRTCWFSGATPTLTTSLYIGCDDNRTLGQSIYGSQTVLPIWKEFNKQVGSQQKKFNYDPSLKEISIDSKTAQSIPEDDPNSISILVDQNYAYPQINF